MTSNNQTRLPIIPSFSILAWLLIMVSQVVCGQELVYETEPNNTPEGFNPVAGEVNIAGAMTGVDQDGFLWTVSDADAEKRWTIRLDGIPGALTIIQVFRLKYAENGVDLAGKEKLFGMGSRDGAQPVFERDLLFEPGEYVLGFAYAGGGGAAFRPPTASLEFGDTQEGSADNVAEEPGGYRAEVRASSRMNVRSHVEPPSGQSNAQALRPQRFFSSFIASENSWYRLELDEKQGGSVWEIRGQLPVGQKAKVYLRDAEGAAVSETQVDNFGRFLFTDLGLGPGTHFVEIQGKQANMIRVVENLTIGQRIKGAEAEENGSWANANTVDWSVPVTGRLGVNNDYDFFRFTLDEAGADSLLELSMETDPEEAIQLCLLDALGKNLQCRKSAGAVALPKLALTPGDWGVLVSRGPKGAEYTLRLQGTGGVVADAEVEPNDSVELAVSMPAKNRIKGRFDTGGDVDFYRFLVTDEAQLWRFQAIGDELHRIVYYDGAGKHGQEFRQASQRLRLENVFLMPGQHYIAVHGKPGTDYTLLARPLGPPDSDGEREPNDNTSQMQRLEIGQRRNGLLTSTSDIDLYRFTLFNWDRMQVSVEPPADGNVSVHLYWEYPNYFSRDTSKVGESLVYEGLFPPGQYVVSVKSTQPSDAEYHLGLQRLDRFGCPVDCEPNSNPALARPVPASMVIEGSNAGWDSYDVYALPVLEKAQELVVRADQKYRLVVHVANSTENLVTWDDTIGAFRGTIPAEVITYLDIRRANDGYRLALEYANGPAPLPDAVPPDAELTLDLETDTVKAYRRYGQRLKGHARVSNSGTRPLTLQLEAATSDKRWEAELARSTVEVAAGATVDVPVTVMVPKDAWARNDVRLSLRAGDRGGAVTAFQDIAVDSSADAINPTHHYSLPDELLGGFNVAEQRFGGRWDGDYDTSIGWSFDQAIDGLAVKNNGMALRGGYKGEQAELKIDLAGDEPVSVAGVVMHSLNGNLAQRFLRIADVAVSIDGTEWQPVLFENLDPIGAEQAFAFDKPVTARFARVLLEHNWSGRPRAGESLGEFKVIASPGVDISNGAGFNLGRRDLGGHVVWARPRIDAGWSNGLLKEDEQPTARIKIGESQSWVVAFHHNRAALLDRFEWVHSPRWSDNPQFSSVKVAVSLDSPLGPWTPVGEWTLSPTDEMQTFKPEQPVWARYVKFTTNPVEVFDWHPLPSPLRLWEVPTSNDYRSALTEWGDRSQQAYWESLQPIPPEPSFKRAQNDTRERAAALATGEQASGAVLLAEHEHWYQLEVPPDQNTLKISLTGRPTVRTEVTAETADGERIVLRRNQNTSTSYEHIFEAVVDPGSMVYLRIQEPPRNVVFIWDTSASVGPYLPVIYNALNAYSQDVKPGLDAVNYMPFGRGLLLEEWYGEPYVLQTVLNEYPQRESSSAAEQTLASASRALAPRSGTKAIVLMTDAATSAYRGGLWEAFKAARPRIFALGVSSEGAFGRDPYHEEDLMADWASINGGYYSHLLSAGELEVAFERAQTLLREPAPYALRVDTEFRKAPGPGMLSVVAGDGTGQASGGAIELILDASGSMLKRQQGKRRIAIAREVLTEAVNEWIPDGTPVALRVFGHRQPNACRTDLEVPLAPINRDAMAATISGVQAMNLAKTPIAASLAAAAGDLSGADGGVSILLLTDGEETCEGDPAQAIAHLQEKGIDVTLNIVGFAIGDKQTEALFTEWAALGGGRYFSASDQAGLAEAVNTALKMPFIVYSQDGSRVAEGLVGGDAIEVEAGFYRVVVEGAPSRVFEDVEIAGESSVELELNTRH